MSAEQKQGFAPPHGALHDFTGYLLRLAYVAAVEAGKAAIPPPHRIRELLILILLREHGPLSQQDLAGILQVNRTIMVGLIDGLEERDLLRRERNATDRRSYALVPTELGRTTLQTLEPALARVEEILTANLTAAERQRLRAALRRTIPDSELADGPLSMQTGYLLKHAHYARREIAAAALAPLGLEPRQFGALLTLRELQPCSQQELAAGLGVSPPVVLQLIDELEAARLVQRSRNEHDRRSYDVTLTADGEQRLGRALAIVAELNGENRSQPHDRELHSLLSKLLGT